MAKKGLIAAVTAFAASPQGRKMMRQAKDYARSPEGQRKIQELRGKVSGGQKKRPY